MSIFTDKNYINRLSPNLQLFTWKKDDLANCRCPVCGDSSKNKRKARGYFYRKANHMYYKCHNCDFGCSLGNMIKRLSPSLHKEYRLENYRAGEVNKPNVSKPEFKFEPVKLKEKIGVPIQDSLLSVSFLEARRIPENLYSKFRFSECFIDDVKKINTDISVGSESRILIPVYDEKKNLIGVQGRAMNGEKPKYITIKTNGYQDQLIYGLDSVNDQKTVCVFEGPIDSMFIPNSVAVLGANLKGVVEKFSDCVFCFDNEPRNKQIVSKMQEAIDLGEKVCIWPESLKIKDINDMIVSGMTVEMIQNIIELNTFSGNAARLKFVKWRKA